jgi:hypothetical protein
MLDHLRIPQKRVAIPLPPLVLLAAPAISRR